MLEREELGGYHKKLIWQGVEKALADAYEGAYLSAGCLLSDKSIKLDFCSALDEKRKENDE